MFESGQKDGWLIVSRVEITEIRMSHSDFLKTCFSRLSSEVRIPPKLLQQSSLRDLCTTGILCEISARSDGYVEDYGDIFFIEEEFRFYPIGVDGVYPDDGYLVLEESNIISLQYYSHYLKSLEQLGS